MARLRTLKPSFFKDLDLAECSFAARLFFEGLWCHADREGRLRDEPKRLKAEIFPYDDVDAEALLAELARTRKHKPGVIIRYEICGERYILIPHFLDHQKPYHKEIESVIPPPDSSVYLDSRARPQPVAAQTALSLVVPSSVSQNTPIAPASGGTQVSALKVLKNAADKPDPVKLKKRNKRKYTLAEEQDFKRHEQRDLRSRALFDWLDRQRRPVWDEALEREVERAAPSRDEQLAWVQENCHASPEDAADIVALVENAIEVSRAGARNGT